MPCSAIQRRRSRPVSLPRRWSVMTAAKTPWSSFRRASSAEETCTGSNSCRSACLTMSASVGQSSTMRILRLSMACSLLLRGLVRGGRVRGRFLQGEVEGGASSGGGLDPDAAVVEFDDAFADGEADACAFDAVGGARALKDLEDSLAVFGRDAHAVVCDPEAMATAGADVADADDGGASVGEFEGVGKEVAEEFGDADAVATEGGKGGIEADFGACLLNGDTEAFGGFGDDVVEVYLLEGVSAAGDAGDAEEVADEAPQASAGRFDEVEILARGGVEGIAFFGDEHVGERFDAAEGFLDVVGDDVGEVVEFLVGVAKSLIGGGGHVHLGLEVAVGVPEGGVSFGEYEVEDGAYDDEDEAEPPYCESGDRRPARDR